MQIRASKVVPRLFQIAQLAGKDFYRASLINGVFPRQRHVSIGVAIEERECLDDDGNGGMKLCPCAMKQVPLFPRLWMERIAGQSQGYPRAAVDENLLAFVASGLVVNAIVLDGRAFWLTIPDRNWS